MRRKYWIIASAEYYKDVEMISRERVRGKD
jgi:hypothetical protein